MSRSRNCDSIVNKSTRLKRAGGVLHEEEEEEKKE
jgi:hypothetical protein